MYYSLKRLNRFASSSRVSVRRVKRLIQFVELSGNRFPQQTWKQWHGTPRINSATHAVHTCALITGERKCLRHAEVRDIVVLV